MSKRVWLVVLILQVTASIAHAQLPLPPAWTAQDIGNVGIPGSASRDSTGDEESTWSISGSGSDIWGTSDSFFFVFQRIGDGGLFATPNLPENTNPHAKAGLMIRQSTDPASAFVIVDYQPDGSVEFMTRPSTGAETQFVAGLPPGSRGFFGLSRKGGTVSATFCALTCQQLGSVPFPEGVALIGLAVTSHDNSVLNHAKFSGEPNLLKLPASWRSFDVAATPPDQVGDAYFMHDTFTVIGYGADIWGTADEYRAVSTAFRGDGYISARVTQEQADNTFAKAGVAITNGSGNATVILDVRPNGLIEFMARPTNGAPMEFIATAGAGVSFPVWLKLQRTGDLFTGSISEDGQTWQVVGSTMVHMEFPEARLVVTSHDRSQPNTSTFDHVVVASHLLTDTDVGDVGQAGCVCGIGGNGNTTTYLQGGSGADIWGTQDAFNFDYRLLLDDQQVVAKVHDISADAGVSIDPFAKAGVMIRESLDPSSPFVILDVRPGGEIEFMARHSPGGETEFISGGTTTIPVMLRLTRNGSSIVGETSLDGTNWNTVGVAAVNFSAAPLAGNVVTSHNRGTITYGSFEEPVLK